MWLQRTLWVVVAAAALGGLAVAAVLTRERWQPLLAPPAGPAEGAGQDHDHEHAHGDRVRLSPEARANLGLLARPLQPQTYWRSLTVPGTVVERPGVSDQGVTAPVAAVVAAIHARPGDTV